MSHLENPTKTDVFVDIGQLGVASEEVVSQFRLDIERGKHWFDALLDAIGAWGITEENINGVHYKYLYAGEAFDWLALAERLVWACEDLIPSYDRDNLLFDGVLPDDFDREQFKDLLGIDKYRAYLNYYYGIVVEEALHLAVELDLNKRFVSNGHQYSRDFTNDIFKRIYSLGYVDLLTQFREINEKPFTSEMHISELKEFTYWLFKYRIMNSDKARTASDTKKGLDQLMMMKAPTPTDSEDSDFVQIVAMQSERRTKK